MNLDERRSKEQGLKAQLIRLLEKRKQNNEDISVASICYELAIPQSFIYESVELLTLILKNANVLSEVDALMLELFKDNANLRKKNRDLSSKLNALEREKRENGSDNFLEASMIMHKYVKTMQADEYNLTNKKDIYWAKGVLKLSHNESYDLQETKKQYRKLKAILHPDHSHRDTTDELILIEKAFQVLKDQYPL
jgi:hypothetical protein